jgi:hypothetical protein
MPSIVATGVDLSYAGSGMNYDTVKAKGYSIVGRYVGTDSRCLTIPERDRIYAAGLRLYLIGQRGPVTQPRGGYKQGLADGAFFDSEADKLAYPVTKPILCAIADVGDGFPTTQDLPVIKDFFKGLWESIRRPVGIYGPYWIIEAFRGDPRVFCYWETAGASGNGNGTGGSAFNPGDNSWRRLSDLACMYQEYSNPPIPGTDHNQVYESNLRMFTWHPDDVNSTEQPEENYDMKAVFCPDQTGRVGWRSFTVDGKRCREGYASREDLDVDLGSGLVDGEVTLRGDQGALFLARYLEFGYQGPRLITVTSDSQWGRDVAKLLPGESARFYVIPNQYIIRIHDDGQYGADRYVGVAELPMGEAFLWNQPLLPWGIDTIQVQVNPEGIHVDAEIKDADKVDIAKRTTDLIVQRLQD